MKILNLRILIHCAEGLPKCTQYKSNIILPVSKLSVVRQADLLNKYSSEKVLNPD